MLKRRKNEERAPKKIYLFQCKDGQFMKTEYEITGLNRLCGEYDLSGPDGRTDFCSVQWIGNPRAASLWTYGPDPEAAYKKILESAQKDLEKAKGQLKAYAGVFDRVMAAGIGSGIGNPEPPARPGTPSTNHAADSIWLLLSADNVGTGIEAEPYPDRTSAYEGMKQRYEGLLEQAPDDAESDITEDGASVYDGDDMYYMVLTEIPAPKWKELTE